MKLIDKFTVEEIINLLPNGTRQKLSLLLVFQIIISTLDIFAILLLGLVSKSGLDYSQGKPTTLPKNFVDTLKIDDFTFVTQVGIIFVLVIILFVFRTLISVYGNKRIYFYLANQAGHASRRILEKIFRSKPQFVISRNSQEFLYGVTQGIDNLTLNFLGSATIFLTEIVFLTLILTVLFVIQPLTGLMAFLIFASAAIGIHKITSEKAKTMSAEYSRLMVVYNRRLLDTLLVYRELVLRQKEFSATQEVQVARSKSLSLRARLIFLPTLSKYLFELVLVLGGSIIAIIQLTVSDTATAISSVTVFLAAASRILPSLIRAQGSLLSIRQSEGSAEITLQQLRELDEHTSLEAPASKPAIGSGSFVPSIKVENLTFAYDGDSSFVLKNINLEVKTGQFVAIVGESGSGKTTLIDLMLGMLTPQSGKIEVSNCSPLDAIRHWPGKIAYVPQDVAIIDGDIQRNITLEENSQLYGDEILVALEKAHLKDDVLRMPSGLRELVGERGIRLSGGQRQRLGIARALYTQPEMIIFDEATSSLDPLTEKTVTDSIYGKKSDITLIVVAHRLSTVKNADVVILMDKGKILAQGTFEEVRSSSPKFDQQAKLANL
jgi:ATP-binding cassette subfamily C protein